MILSPHTFQVIIQLIIPVGIGDLVSVAAEICQGDIDSKILINSSLNHLEVFNLVKSLDIHQVLQDFAHRPYVKKKRNSCTW